MRIGVYVDTVFREGSAGRVKTDSQVFAFLHFVCEVASGRGELVLFGRRPPESVAVEYELPSSASLVALPYYPSLTSGAQVLKAVPGTLRAMWRGLDDVDLVWVFGPYPFSPALIACALLRRRKVTLGVRQDTMEYFRSRLPHPLAAPVLAPLWAIDRLYRLLSRGFRTVVVGEFLEREYGGPRAGVLPIRISLVRESSVVAQPHQLDWAGPVRLLTVGRVDAEKNPLLLVDALSRLERRNPGLFVLTWVGEGPMLEATRQRARELGLADQIDFRGYVAFGPELLELYRSSHLFVHVALTEGLAQVLTEAMASGLAIVATRVGGVAAALDEGAAGLLVPPSEPEGLAVAIRRLCDDGALRQQLIQRGLALARAHSLETEAARTAHFLLSHHSGEGSPRLRGYSASRNRPIGPR